MAIGNIAVDVVPDATNFWRDFRARTSGQAEAEGRRQGDEFRRGMQGTADRGHVRIRADVDTTRARAEINSLQREGQQSGGGLLKALLPLAPALVPLAGAATAAGAAIGATFASSILAVLGFKNAMTEATDTGARTAASVSAVKDALGGLEGAAAHAALPGLEQSVATITSQLPRLRQIVVGQATIAGEVAAHLTRGIIVGFENFGPVITMVSRDIDSLAAHFEAWATGPGGANFARTLATDYQKVRPEIISVEHAVAGLLAAGSSSGLGIVSLIGDLARAIEVFPRPLLTAIVDGFLAFRAIGLATTAYRAIEGALGSVGTAVQGVAAKTQVAALQRASAEAEAASATAAAEASMAQSMLATAEAAQEARIELILGSDSVSAAERAQLEVQAAAADEQIANYQAVAIAAQASAAEQAAAAEEAAAAAETAGAAAGAASLGSILGPIGLAVGGLLLLTTAFGDDGNAAQAAANEIDGYTSALLNSNGAIDQGVRAQAASALQQQGLIAAAKQYGITQGQLTDAVLNGGSALDSVNAILTANETVSSRATAKTLELGGAYDNTKASATVLKDEIRGQVNLFQQSTSAAADQQAAIDNVSAATRAQARALHTTVGAYVASESAAAGSVEKTREQTVAFQLANDAASLLSQALKSLAGENLGVAQAETSFQQSIHSTITALRQGHDAITGNSDAALANQQAIQGSVSAARQYADAVAQQTGSSSRAAAAYRNSRDALLEQLRAQGQLTPAVRKYVNSLFDVKGVSDYLAAHPTKHDVQLRAHTAAANAEIHKTQSAINAIRQGKVPGLTANSAEGRRVIAALQRTIDNVHQGKKPGIGLDIAEALAKKAAAQAAIDALRQGHRPNVSADISYLQGQIAQANALLDSLHDRTVTVTYQTVGNLGSTTRSQVPGSAAGSASWTPDGKLPPGLSTVGERGWELVSTDSRGRSQVFSHAQSVAMTGLPKNLPGFANGTAAAQARVQATNSLVSDAHSLFGALSGSVAGMRAAAAAFVKDFKAAGATTRQTARAAADQQKLIANQQRLVAARALLTKVTDYSSSVKGSLSSGFDLTKYGSVADLVTGLKGQTGQDNAFTREVNKLRREAHGNKSELNLINNLAANGQSSSLEALAGGSVKDLANAGRAYHGYNASLQAGADAASVAKYGTTQAQADHRVERYERTSDRLLHGIAELAATVARSHGKSGARVERELEQFAHKMQTLIEHGRAS